MLKLLEALWGDRAGYGEVRAMKAGKVTQRFLPWPPTDARMLEEIERLAADHDMYYGVLLRVRESGKAADCERMVHWLWADVDKKAGATFASLLSARVPPPQIVVDSGHGWHLYWRLAQPVSHAVAQAAMADIASQVNGDAVGDPARILRIAGTRNFKSDPPMLVRILRWKDLDRGWRLGDFDLRLAERRTTRVSGGPTGAKGTRSEDLFILALDLIRKGKSNPEIYAEMLSDPAGSKISEMPKARADRWVNLTITKARRLLS
jgi:hypothetical protein